MCDNSDIVLGCSSEPRVRTVRPSCNAIRSTHLYVHSYPTRLNFACDSARAQYSCGLLTAPITALSNHSAIHARCHLIVQELHDRRPVQATTGISRLRLLLQCGARRRRTGDLPLYIFEK